MHHTVDTSGFETRARYRLEPALPLWCEWLASEKDDQLILLLLVKRRWPRDGGRKWALERIGGACRAGETEKLWEVLLAAGEWPRKLPGLLK